jgi:antitoxin (DNA-binding transcriptional repressor) of toxin-antitoxin stability system
MTVCVHEAETQLSKLLDLLGQGEDIVILRHGKPVAHLVRAKSAAKPQFGAMRGEIEWREGWEKPMTLRKRRPIGRGVERPCLLDTSTLWVLADPSRLSAAA